MNKIMANIQRFRKIRQLHTIISQDIIKPFSPTPPHLKTHNLSSIDYAAPNIHMPLIFFYKNYNNTSDINILKKSLSQCLTQYYPFAGRLPTPFAPCIDCNDQGVEFFEASVDSRLDDFILKKEQDESLDQLIPNALGCLVNITSPSMAAVQLNHFTCGGVAVALSISHKIADAFTITKFINDWACVTSGGSPVKLDFFSSSISKIYIPEVNIDIPEVTPMEPSGVKYVARSFVFPNSKLNELKKKINAMDTTPLNPTRVESLTSLLFKCAVDAATAKSGYFIPSSLHHLVNLRGKAFANFPQSAVGNLIAVVTAKMMNSGQCELNEVITGLRKEIMELQGVKDAEDVAKKMMNAWQSLMDKQIRSTSMSSALKLPFYQADFGWGKPVRVILRSENVDANLLVLMDTPNGDGIEATVNLNKEEMSIFEKDQELLAYVQDI